MRRTLTVLVSLACAASPAAADMCSWNPKPVAESALRYLAGGTTVQEYCLPCGDSAAKKTVVSSASVKQVDPKYWQVQMNGGGIDLAYVYVPDPSARGSWTNLALLVKCEDATEQDVPRILPRNLVR